MAHKSSFVYNGVSSLDMHLTILNDVSFPSPEADIEFVEVLGRDGDLAVNHNRLKGVDFSLPVALIPPKGVSVNVLATKIAEWLKSDIGWHPLSLSSVEEYDYIAIVQEAFDVEQTLRQFGRTVITFRLKPYKRRRGQSTFELTDTLTIHNPEQRASKPLIEVVGKGNISLSNNRSPWLTLRGVDGRITVDSELMSVYKDARPQYDKMASNLTPLFPELVPGENNLTVTGNATITIHPRWEAII